MIHASIRSLAGVALAGLGMAAFAGCGNDVPTGAVAKVGDATISKADFDKWLTTAASGQAQAGQGAAPDPPDYANCVKAKQTTAVPQGQKQPTEAALKKQCKQEYDTLKREVMQFLIQAEWVQQEADKQGIEVSDAEIKRSFEDQKKASFPTDKAYQNFLKTSGMSEEDILFRVKLDQLQQKLTQKITKEATKVSDEDVEEYYDKNKKRFAQPERRDLQIVLTKNEAKANEAKSAIEGGQTFRQVAKEYSIDEASKAQGGKLPAVAKGQQEKSLDEAVFAAEKGTLEGPVKTQFGWYVFEVTKIEPASQQSLEQATETIKNLLRSQRQQTALDDFIKDFREDYKADTDCASDYEVAECSNGPDEGTDTGPASGGAPQGAEPQQPTPQPTPQPQPQP
ncbi:MAG TPA: peptidyl-prolyl cis-trans isomerase [Thermoleophilaceae bacterium]|nr:peptidyl-prolyl cis-trans isomerase [Thermoleophilaceae bacterium]